MKKSSPKKRLDVLLVERGLTESRQKAQAVILAGQVRVNEQLADKAGSLVAVDAAIEIMGQTLRYVSRGGLKIAATAAQHRSNRSYSKENKTLWASYVIQSNQYKIFYGGDGGYGESEGRGHRC